jgi:PEP-CTERM motif
MKSFALLISSALLVGAAALPANADPLPNAVSYEYFGLNLLANVQESDTVGTLDYTGQPGCGSTCSATTQLGASPSVSATLLEVPYGFGGTVGGFVIARLGYYVEYLNVDGTYNVNLHATDSLTDGGQLSAAVIFGTAGPSTANFNNFASVTFQEAQCVNGCPSPGFAFPTSTVPFTPDHQVAITANTPYFIEMDLVFRPGDAPISGFINSQFSSDFGGQFIFSPGVFTATSAVPEPSTWVMMILGFAGIGFMAYRRQHKALAIV